MGLSYDALFPGRFIKAGEMSGKPVTMTIADVYLDHLEGEDGREKPQAIVSFKETKREWALNKTNAQCLLAMWGPDSGDWITKHVTLFAERDASGLSDSGLCLRVKGSPDITKSVVAEIKLPRRKPQKRTLVPTGNGKAPANVDEDTGEVFAFDEDAPHAAQEAAGGAATPDSESVAAEAVSDADGQIPGMGADEYAASRGAPPTLLHPPKVTASQVATIGRLRKASGIYEAEYVALLDSSGAAAAGELSKESAGYVIAALEEREAAS
jgi:hypothetical protein